MTSAGDFAPSSLDITELLVAWERGDDEALRCLAPLVYDDLRALAAAHLRGERPGHTLQPTALVHEAFLRLSEQRQRAALEEAVTLRQAAEGADSAHVARYLNDLGSVLQQLEDWEGAGQAAERARTIFAKEYGTKNLSYGVALINLARVRLHERRLEEAAALQQEGIRVYQETFGPRYPGEASHRNWLGWTYLEAGRNAEAKREFEHAIAASVRESGPDSVDTAYFIRGLRRSR